jgi:hypothetical protein
MAFGGKVRKSLRIKRIRRLMMAGGEEEVEKKSNQTKRRTP